MRIIDKYIIKKFLSTFLFVVFIVVAIVVVIDITEKLDEYSRNNLGVIEVAGYYFNYIPFIANLITPITTFIATVFITAKMANHSEIIAILSNGTSFNRLLMPYFIGASIIAVVSFYFNGWVIPKTSKERIAFEVKHLKKRYYFGERNFHIQVAPNQYLFMESYNNQVNVGVRFTLEKFHDNKLVEKLSARRIEWDKEKENWRLINWQRRVIKPDREVVTFGDKMDTTLIIHPREFESDYRLYEGMTLPELNRYISELEARGAEGKEIYIVEKYVRYTAPFAILILTFIGVIVSARKSRGGAGFQIALGFLMSFIFIIFFVMSKGTAEKGSLNPLLGVWLPNIIFGLVGIIMYRTVPR